MKALTVYKRQIEDGIVLTQDERLGLILRLGNSGKGLALKKIKLDSRTPAKVTDGRIHAANLTSYEVRGDRGPIRHYALKKHEVSDQWNGLDLALVRVVGFAQPYQVGSPECVQSGVLERGIGDTLWVLHPGDALNLGYQVIGQWNGLSLELHDKNEFDTGFLADYLEAKAERESPYFGLSEAVAEIKAGGTGPLSAEPDHAEPTIDTIENYKEVDAPGEIQEPVTDPDLVPFGAEG